MQMILDLMEIMTWVWVNHLLEQDPIVDQTLGQGPGLRHVDTCIRRAVDDQQRVVSQSSNNPKIVKINQKKNWHVY